MVATMPESIYRSSLDGYTRTLDLDYCVLCYGWLHPYHIYHVIEILVVLLHAGSPAAVCSVARVLVKHFTPLSLSVLMLYEVSVTQQFVTVLVTPPPHLGGLIPGPVRSDMT